MTFTLRRRTSEASVWSNREGQSQTRPEVSSMARKPAKMYRRLKGPAYTRRKYIGGVPNNRILNFYAGNRRAAETGEFLMELNLIAD